MSSLRRLWHRFFDCRDLCCRECDACFSEYVRAKMAGELA